MVKAKEHEHVSDRSGIGVAFGKSTTRLRAAAAGGLISHKNSRIPATADFSVTPFEPGQRILPNILLIGADFACFPRKLSLSKLDKFLWDGCLVSQLDDEMKGSQTNHLAQEIESTT